MSLKKINNNYKIVAKIRERTISDIYCRFLLTIVPYKIKRNINIKVGETVKLGEKNYHFDFWKSLIIPSSIQLAKACRLSLITKRS